MFCNMDLPEVQSLNEFAIDTVVSIINRAKEKLGQRQTLQELAYTRENFGVQPKLNLSSIQCPVAVTAEAFIADTIERKWRLGTTFMFVLHYRNCSRSETSNYYYFEAVFSQPTAAYPIPQATASVYFRVQDRYVEPPMYRPIPSMIFRVEGQYTEYDIRFVRLEADWLLAVIKMKTLLSARIEKLKLF